MDIFNFDHSNIKNRIIMRRFLRTASLLLLWMAGFAAAHAQVQTLYSINFGESQEGWTAIDNSPYNVTPNTWKVYSVSNGGQSYPSVSITQDWTTSSDDWYISPALQLEAGVTYTVSTIAGSDAMGNGDVALSLNLGTSATDVSTFTKIADLNVENGVFNATEIETHTFTIEESGAYYIAFRSLNEMFGPSINLFSFEITYEGGQGGGEEPAAGTKVPYTVVFGDTQEGWTAIDVNSDGTWAYSANELHANGQDVGSVVLMPSYSAAADDWYVSPALQLEAGVEYTVNTISSCGNWNAMNETFEVSLCYGTSATDVSSFTSFGTLAIENNVANVEEMNVHALTVPESGVYYIAYHATNPAFTSSTCLVGFEITDGTSGGDDPAEKPETVPYSIDLNASNEGWTPADNNGDFSTWVFTEGFGPTLMGAFFGTNNDDYISPAIQLEGGKTYCISTIVTFQTGGTGNESIQLMQGTSADALQYLGDLTLGTAAGPYMNDTFFTPEADGAYHFAFRNLSGEGATISLSSFAIDESQGVAVGEVVFESDFAEANPLEGWTVLNENADAAGWEAIDGLSGISYNGMAAPGAADDWLITPAIEVSDGVDYIVEYTFAQSGAFDPDIVEIASGASAEVAAMSVLTREEYNLGSGTETRSYRVSPDGAGQIFIGFHLVTPTVNGTFSLVAIKVTSAAKPTPAAVTGFVATSNYEEKSVALAWTNPAVDTNAVPLSGTVSLDILENGERIHTMADRLPGAEETYSFNPENFAGNATYSIVAFIGDNRSAAVEQTINLDDMQGDTLLVEAFGMATQEEFDAWTVEDKNAGQTWIYESWEQRATIPMGSVSNDDWLITPGIELQAGVRYLVMYSFRSNMNYGGDLEVTVGNAATADAQTTVLESYTDLKQNGWGEYATRQFSVESDGTYHIGFHAGTVQNGMSVRNVRVMYIGEEDEEVVISSFPYSQDFDEAAETPEGWMMGGNSGNYGFQVVNNEEYLGVPGMEAYSAPNSLVMTGGYYSGREEQVFTPKFALEQGQEYEVSFQLYMPVNNGRYNTLQVYALAEQDAALADGEPLLEISNADVAEWTEESFTFAPEEAGNYCFLLQVSAGISGTGYVMIDDFELAEYVPLAVPAAPEGLRAGASYTGELILNWTNPATDINGEPLNAALAVTSSIYDQDGYLGSVTGAPGSLCSYTHPYAADAFHGQKIIRVVSSIESLEGGAATTVATITSLGDGYLKEQTFASDFTSVDGWKIIDADEDGNAWANDAEAGTVSTAGHDEWLISPAVELEEGMTYYVVCELSTDMENGANIAFCRGGEATAAGMSTLMAAYSGLQLSSRATLEIGETFVADEPVQHFGIYVDAENKGLATVAGLKVYRIFGSSEPEAVPYAQDFEDRINVDEYGMPNKWMRNTSSESIFTVSQMPENTIAAHSGEYAAIANESVVRNRVETLSTPLFDFEEGWVYGISFYLYMPGNEGRNTTGMVSLAPSQSYDAVEELPIVREMNEPVTEWTKFDFEYSSESAVPYCFIFTFAAAEAQSGIIAIDDFKVEKLRPSVGICEEEASVRLAYDQESAMLFVPEGCTKVTVYNLQGMPVYAAETDGSPVGLGHLEKGLYVAVAQDAESHSATLKLMR